VFGWDCSNFRYLYEVTTEHTTPWTDLSLIEWEAGLSLLKEPNDILKEAESKLSQIDVHNFASPAFIVIFASLYSLLRDQLPSSYSSVQHFLTSFLETDFAKNGIKTTTGYIAEPKINKSTVTQQSTKSVTAGVRHLKSGIFAEKLHEKKM
jgi:hypothetical protein